MISNVESKNVDTCQLACLKARPVCPSVFIHYVYKTLGFTTCSRLLQVANSVRLHSEVGPGRDGDLITNLKDHGPSIHHVPSLLCRSAPADCLLLGGLPLGLITPVSAVVCDC